MGFAGGSISFKRLYVLGDGYRRVDEEVIKRLADHAHGADSIRTADNTELGWITGQHIFDTRFDFAKNSIADGLHFALRVDTNKPPSDLVRGYQRLAEEAMLEASGREFLSKAERKEEREQAKSRAEKEAKSGAFLRSRTVPVFWDLRRNEVYLGGTSPTLIDQFMLLFRETFDRSLSPATSGEMAAHWAVKNGEGRGLDDCTPAHFVNPPEGAAEDSSHFGQDGASRKDFLGTEFLTWLLYSADVGSSEITTPTGQSVALVFEKSLQLQCAFRLTGTISITADGPADLPESAVALASGKLPIKAGMQIAVHGDAFGFTLRPDAMNFSGMMLPESTDVNDPRAMFEERMDHLRDAIETMDGLYIAFLKRRLSNKWPATLSAVRAWIAAGRAGTRKTESFSEAVAS